VCTTAVLVIKLVVRCS